MHIVERCREYLSSGGLFNPELMDHQKVSDLVIDCRDEIERLRKILLTGTLMLSEIGISSAEKCQMAYDHLSAALKGTE
jgi:hypothetical protein